MTVYEKTIERIQNMPEPLLSEVNDFLDFLQLKQNARRWQMWQLFQSSLADAESDMTDYLANLEDYENRLVKGEIKW